MDDRQLEAALRAGPPAEPKSRGDIAHLLQARAMSPSNGVQAELAVEVVARPLHRRRRWPAFVGAAAAAVVLIVGLTTIARRDTPPSATTPPSTSVAPNPTVAPTGLPTELLDRWVGATPPSVNTPNPSAPAFVVFAAAREKAPGDDSGCTAEQVGGQPSGGKRQRYAIHLAEYCG